MKLKQFFKYYKPHKRLFIVDFSSAVFVAIGELVSFVLFLNVLIKPIDKISALPELYPKGMAGFSRFRELIEQAPDINDRKDAVAVEKLNGDIAFINVHFGHYDNPEAF